MRLSLIIGMIGIAACVRDEPLPVCQYQVEDKGWYYEVEISSDAPSVESCFYDDIQDEWICRTIVSTYYGCYRIMKEVWDLRIRIDGCETVLNGYER